MKKILFIALFLAIIPVQAAFAASASTQTLINKIKHDIAEGKAQLEILNNSLPMHTIGVPVNIVVDNRALFYDFLVTSPVMAFELCSAHAINVKNYTQSVRCEYREDVFYEVSF